MTQFAPQQDPGWRQRCNARLGVMMQVLDKQDAPMPLPELQDAVAAVVPLEPYDLTTTSTGATRAWVNLGWNISGSSTPAGCTSPTRVPGQDTSPPSALPGGTK